MRIPELARFHVQVAGLLLGLGVLAANLIPIHVHPFRTFYNELAIVIAILLCVLFEARTNRARFDIPRVALVPAALAIFIVLQCAVGMVESQRVIFPLLYLTLATLSIIWGARVAEDENKLNTTLYYFAICHSIAALLSVGMEVVQVYGLDWRPWVMYVAAGQTNVRPIANVAQPNQLALLLCFGLASLWWLFQQRKLHGALVFIFAWVLVSGIVLTQSRIAWLILPMFAICLATRFVGSRKTPIAALFILLLWYWLFLLNLPIVSDALGFSGGSAFERLGGRSERTVLAQQALRMISEHPMMGIGWFRFSEEQVNLGRFFSPTIYAEHSHNLILNIAAELGLPVALFFIASLSFWLWKVLSKRSMRARDEIGFGLLFVIAVAVHSMVEFPLWYAYVLLPLGFIVGVMHRARFNATSLQTTFSFMSLASVIGLILSVFIVVDFHRVVDGFTEFRRLQSGQRMDESKIEMPRISLFRDYYDYFTTMQLVPREGMELEDIQFIEGQSRRFGFVHILNKLAETYALNGELEKARAMMLTIHRLHPFYYAEYYDYWSKLALSDKRYAQVFASMPARDTGNK